MARKKMGELLLEKSIITQKDLDTALLKQKSQKKPLGQILGDMDLVLEEDIAQILASQFNFPYVKKIARFKFSAEILAMVDADLALRKLIFPLKVDGKTLYLAMANPLDMPAQTELSFKLGMRVSPCVATSGEILSAIKTHYQKEVAAKPVTEYSTETILLIDSQPMILSTLESLLKKEGYAVFIAESGFQGLELAHQLRPDLIVTEINLPKMDGMHLYSEIRNSSDLKNTKVVIFTTRASQEEEARMLDLGVDDFVAKPLQPLRLMARIKKALRK